MNPIPLVDLGHQWRQLRPQLLAAMEQALDGGQYILGQEVAKLEAEVAALCQMPHAVGVANGTDALVLALKALGMGPGDEVITTPFTFFATAEAIVQVGATPVFVDVDRQTYNLDPALIEGKITGRTKAILPVHLFGLMADMPKIRQIADAHQLQVLEDACQAIGAMGGGEAVGFYGDAAVFSFFPTKNLGGYGDGGMVVLADGTAAERIKRLRVHGSVRKYEHEEIGWNSRLDELQAAILRVKLTKLAEWTEERRQVAARYDLAFAGLPIRTPHEPAKWRHVYHLYTIVTECRDELMKELTAQGIGCGVYYPVPLHLQKALQHLGYHTGDLPVAEDLSKSCLSLPLYPGLPLADQQRVIDAVTRFFER